MVRSDSTKPTRSVRSIWLAPPLESVSEKTMLALLVVGAAVAIGYGFAVMLDLVRNWAAFNQGIGQLVQ